MSVRVILLGVMAGGLGGALGWLPGELVALARPTDPTLRYITVALYFLLLSTAIGTSLGVASGLAEGSRQRARQAALAGGLFGLLGGALGGLPGEFAFEALRDAGLGLLGRAVGWGVAGLMIGLAQGVRARSRARTVRGGLGGLLGGYLGGGCFELISLAFPQGALSRLAADVILGALLGGLIIAIEIWLGEAWLVVVSSGPQEGSRFDLSKAETSIGSDDRDDVLLIGGEGIVPGHATVERRETGFWLRPQNGPVLIDGRSHAQTVRLGHESQLQVGSFILLFQERQVACQECGFENGSQARFCKHCGTALPAR